MYALWYIPINMDKMIREIYNNMLTETGNRGKLSREMEEEILNLLERVKGDLSQQEYGEYMDNAFFIACAAEEDGFVKGFKYAFRLFAEFMRE